jgi:hypothetical protein
MVQGWTVCLHIPYASLPLPLSPFILFPSLYIPFPLLVNSPWLDRVLKRRPARVVLEIEQTLVWSTCSRHLAGDVLSLLHLCASPGRLAVEVLVGQRCSLLYFIYYMGTLDTESVCNWSLCWALVIPENTFEPSRLLI